MKSSIQHDQPEIKKNSNMQESKSIKDLVANRKTLKDNLYRYNTQCKSLAFKQKLFEEQKEQNYERAKLKFQPQPVQQATKFINITKSQGQGSDIDMQSVGVTPIHEDRMINAPSPEHKELLNQMNSLPYFALKKEGLVNGQDRSHQTAAFSNNIQNELDLKDTPIRNSSSVSGTIQSSNTNNRQAKADRIMSQFQRQIEIHSASDSSQSNQLDHNKKLEDSKHVNSEARRFENNEQEKARQVDKINESIASALSNWKRVDLIKTVNEKAQKYDEQLTNAQKIGKRTNETEFKSLASKALKNTQEAEQKELMDYIKQRNQKSIKAQETEKELKIDKPVLNIRKTKTVRIMESSDTVIPPVSQQLKKAQTKDLGNSKKLNLMKQLLKASGQHSIEIASQLKEEMEDTQVKKNTKKRDSLAIHQEQLRLKNAKLDRKWNDIYGIQKIQEELVNNKIKIIKYNYSLDKKVQNFDNQEAFLQFTPSGEDMIIVNMKISESGIPASLEQRMKIDEERRKIESMNFTEQKKKPPKLESEQSEHGRPNYNLYSDSDEMHQSEDDNPRNNGLMFEASDVNVNTFKSNASCKISDMEQISFGGFSSRFWALRKHINCMNQAIHKPESMPFFAWQAISIKLKDKEIDISIKNERAQNNFVKYLLYKLNTLEGIAGSADQLLMTMNEQDMNQYNTMKVKDAYGNNKKEFSKTLSIKIRLKNKVTIMRKAYLKYLIIKFRQKISFIAFKKKMSIVELFCDAITRSYNQLVFEGKIQIDELDLVRQNQVYDQMMNGQEVRSLFINIMKLNVEKVRGTPLYDEIQRNIANPKKYMGSNMILNHLKAKVHAQVLDKKENFVKTTKMINKVFDRNMGPVKCADIFKNAYVERKDVTYRLHEKKSIKKYYKDRRLKNETEIRLSKLKLVLGLKSLHGMLFIRALVQKIELTKQLFVMQIQEGQEVQIPYDLSQRQLPLSYRFYDPLIQICQDRMADERKDFYKLKNILKKEIYSQVDAKTQFLNKCGVHANDAAIFTNGAQGLTFKYSAINEKEMKEISIYESIYTMGLQRSNYLQIDNELMHDLQQNPQKVLAMTKVSNAAKKKNSTSITEEDCEAVTDQVYIKYCRKDDVRLKRQLFLQYKGQFQLKLAQLKNKGQMLFTLHKAMDWIDENIETLFHQYKNSKNKINLNPNQASAKQIKIKQMIEQQMESITIPRSVLNRDGELVKTNPQKKQLHMSFKLDNKLAFITNDLLKRQFIEDIEYEQMVSEITEKEKYREFLKQYCENMIKLNRRRIHLKHFNEMKKMRKKSTGYEENSVYIENSIERDIQFFVKMHVVDSSQHMLIKERVKKVEQQIKANKAKHESKKKMRMSLKHKKSQHQFRTQLTKTVMDNKVQMLMHEQLKKSNAPLRRSTNKATLIKTPLSKRSKSERSNSRSKEVRL